MTSKKLKLEDVITSKAGVDIEFDEPALRVLFTYDTDSNLDNSFSLLYWNLGGRNEYYSLGIDIDGGSKKIQLVDLRLYGDKIYKWPDFGNLEIPSKSGTPIINVDWWEENSATICDVDELFKIQARENMLRIEIASDMPNMRVMTSEILIFEFNSEQNLCGIVFRNLDSSIYEKIIDRYGLYEEF
jgi:hypothetical protein